MGIPTEYIKETDGKRIARLLQYKLMLYRRISPFSKSLVLCGPEAGEAGCLKHLLNIEAQEAFFADWREQTGLKRASNQWAGVRCHYGDVKDVLESEKDFSFINLDLMGHFQESTRKLVALAGHRILPWGFFFYTFFRGREWGWRRRELMEMQGDSLDENRLVKNSVEITKALGSKFEPVFSLLYQSNEPGRTIRHSTMGVLGFQRTGGAHLIKLPMWNEGCSTGMLTGEPVGLRKRVSFEAVGLRSGGLRSKQISEVLNVESGTVAAWLAHSTRGTYTTK